MGLAIQQTSSGARSATWQLCELERVPSLWSLGFLSGSVGVNHSPSQGFRKTRQPPAESQNTAQLLLL